MGVTFFKPEGSGRELHPSLVQDMRDRGKSEAEIAHAQSVCEMESRGWTHCGGGLFLSDANSRNAELHPAAVEYLEKKREREIRVNGHVYTGFAAVIRGNTAYLPGGETMPLFEYRLREAKKEMSPSGLNNFLADEPLRFLDQLAEVRHLTMKDVVSYARNYFSGK